MPTRRPLVIINGSATALPSGDKIPTDSIPDNVVLPGTTSVTLPSGTTANRGTGGAGQCRFNTELDRYEGWTSDGWVPLSNLLVSVYRGSVLPMSGTTRIPYDNTPPLITEGTQVWSKTVTPKYVGSIMTIEFAPVIDCNNNGQGMVLAAFRDNTLIGWTGGSVTSGTANKPNSLTLIINDVTTSLTPITYSVRFGNQSTGTWYLGQGAAATMGGGNNMGWKIDEVLP